jgi:hypothetical protein
VRLAVALGRAVDVRAAAMREIESKVPDLVSIASRQNTRTTP